MEEARYEPIETWKNQDNTPDAVFEGVKAANGWKTGKQVTETAYKEAVEQYNKAPMDGRVVK